MGTCHLISARYMDHAWGAGTCCNPRCLFLPLSVFLAVSLCVPFSYVSLPVPHRLLPLLLTRTSHENSLPGGKPSELAQSGAQPFSNKHKMKSEGWFQVWAQ